MRSLAQDAQDKPTYPLTFWALLAFGAINVALALTVLAASIFLPTDGAVILPPDNLAGPAVVSGVMAGHSGGLQVGDAIMQVDGHLLNALPAASETERAALVSRWQTGVTLPYRIRRGEAELTVHVTLFNLNWLDVLRDNALLILSGLIHLAIGLFVLIRRPRDKAAQSLYLIGVGTESILLFNVLRVPISLLVHLELLQLAMATISLQMWYVFPSIFNLFVSFPQEKAFIRRWPWLRGLLGLPLLVAASAAFVGRGETRVETALINLVRPSILIGIVFLAGAVAAALHSFATIRGAVERAQIRWTMWGLITSTAVTVVLFMAPSMLFQRPLLDFRIVALFLTSAPLSFAVAILRYRLWDIDLVINRTLVYGALSALLIGGYIALTALFSRLMTLLMGSADNTTVAILATAVTAVAFLPARQAIQRAIDRALYRDKVTFRRNVADLNLALAQVTGHDKLERLISTTLPQSLHLQGAGLSDHGAFAPVALTLPLSLAGRELGALKLGEKLSGQRFDREETELLRQLAHQVALTLANVQLTQANLDLQEAYGVLETQKKEIEKARAAEQRALQREMDLARNIQMSMLPRAAPRLAGLDLAGVCLPARQVGGDLYSYLTLPQTERNPGGGYAIAVGDVTGKGIPAALYMAMSVAMLAAKAPFVADVAQLMDEMNAALHPYMSPNHMNTTLCYMRVEPGQQESDGWTAHIANAGLIAPILKRGGQCEYLDVGGLPLGAQASGLPHRALALPLRSGDTLILSTDGVVEAMNARGELYGFERLAARAACAPAASAEIIDWIIADAQAFMGGAEQHDDITVVVARVTN